MGRFGSDNSEDDIDLPPLGAPCKADYADELHDEIQRSKDIAFRGEKLRKGDGKNVRERVKKLRN